MKISVLTLGCKVNKYESDALIFELLKMGHEASEKLEKADAYIINTCAVTNEAERKSRQMIERARKFNPNAKIFVLGCASQNRPNQFEGRGVSFIGGTSGKKKVLEEIFNLQEKDEKTEKNEQKPAKNAENLKKNHSKTSANTEKFSQIKELGNLQISKEYEDNLFSAQTLSRAFIKVQDGCDRFCTYCIIPYIRGRSRSRSVESIENEISQLPESVKEIVIVGIDVSDFRIGEEKGLGLLFQRLDKFGKRLRLSSLEDSLVTEDFLKKLSSTKNFCPHFHLSLQSGCDRVLKKMNRHYTTAEFENSVRLIRKFFPLAGITTDIIVGFPTETDEDFEETLNFVKKIKFSQLHIFPYSRRDGTVAAKLYKDLPGPVKTERLKILEKIGQELKEEFICQNKTANVLLEEKKGKFWVGYSENYVKCFVEGDFHVGDIVKVKNFRPYKNGALVECE